MIVEKDVMNVLDNSRLEGMTLFLPQTQLERKLYMDTNKVLEAMGGKWDRKAKGHVFGSDVSELLENVLLTGQIISEKQEFQFFPTPRHIADMLVEKADPQVGHTILEPSAGMGAIVRSILSYGYAEEGQITLHLCESNPRMISELQAMCFILYPGDFLEYEPGPVYDRVIANPPFSGQQDIDHVRHMIEVTKPGGRVVSVMSASVMFRENRKTVEFRQLIESMGGEFEMLPEGSFRESGTGVNACVLVVDKAV